MPIENDLDDKFTDTVKNIVPTQDELIAELRKQSKMRFRNTYIILGGLLTLFVLVASAPDAAIISQLPIGAGTVNFLINIVKGSIGASLLYITGRAMMDYPAADFERLGLIARKSPEGAGKYAIAVALNKLAYAIVIVGTYFVS